MEVFSNMPVKIVKTIYKNVSLNGSTDYLTVPDNAALRFGAADFTVEGWLGYSNQRQFPSTNTGDL